MNRKFIVIIICLIGISYGLASLNQYLLNNKITDKQNNISKIVNEKVIPKPKNPDIVSSKPQNNQIMQIIIADENIPEKNIPEKNLPSDNIIKKDPPLIQSNETKIEATPKVEVTTPFSKMPKFIDKNEIAKLKKSVKREVQKADVNRQIDMIGNANLRPKAERKIINRAATRPEITNKFEDIEAINAMIRATNENIKAENINLESQKVKIARQVEQLKTESAALKTQKSEISKQIETLNTEKSKAQATFEKPVETNKNEQVKNSWLKSPQNNANNQRTQAEPKSLTPTVNKLIAAGQSDAKIVVYTTDEGATVRIVSSGPMMYKTMQLKNPERAIITLEGMVHVQSPAIPRNRVLSNVVVSKENRKTQVTLNFKINPVTVKYFNLNSKTLDIRIR